MSVYSVAADRSHQIGINAALSMESFNGKNTDHLVGSIDEAPTLFRFSTQPLTFFTQTMTHLNITSGSRALGESDITVQIKRTADLMGQTYVHMLFAGLCGVWTDTASSVNLLIDNEAVSNSEASDATLAADGTSRMPYYCPYFGIVALQEVQMRIGHSPTLSHGNDHILVHEELLGRVGQNSRHMTGKYGSVLEAQQRSQKACHVYVPTGHFWGRSIGLFMPMQTAAFHQMDLTFKLRPLSSLVVWPLTDAQYADLYDDDGTTAIAVANSAVTYSAGASGFGGAGSKSLRIRDESKTWAQLQVSATLGALPVASNTNALLLFQVMANVVFFTDAERADTNDSAYKQAVTTSQTITTTHTESSQPSARVVKEMDLGAINNAVSALFFFGRKQSNIDAAIWHDTSCGVDTDGPGSGRTLCYIPVIHRVRLTVNSMTLFDATMEEMHYVAQYQHASKAIPTPTFVAMHSFSDVPADFQTSGFANLARTDLCKAEVTMNREAFASNTQVQLACVALLLTSVEYYGGVLSSKWSAAA